MASHLPLLLNPILNSIFNNPHPENSPLKDVYVKLSKSNKDSVIILLPPLDILLNHYDLETEIAYFDLAYSEEFICQHILVTNELKSSSTVKLFKTLNNKEILIKKDTLFTGRNFKRSLKLNILNYEYFQSYNSYFEKGKKFLVMHVDQPLLGQPIKIIPDKIHPPPKRTPSIPRDSNSKLDTPSFDQILSDSPPISNKLSESFQSLFQSFNTQNIQDIPTLSNLFLQNINLSFQLVKSLPKDLMSTIPKEYKLDESIYNYVEHNLYERVWSKITSLVPDFMTPEKYQQLEHLSINQMALTDSMLSDLSQISIIEQRLEAAITKFKSLEITTRSKDKLQTLIDTMSTLSNIEGVIIDADALITLLILVIVKSRIPFVEQHILYIQNVDIDKHEHGLGLVGYTLSTFEAVIYYLKDAFNLENFTKHSEENRQLLEALEERNFSTLKDIYKQSESNQNFLSSSLSYRSQQGESVLSLAIQSNDYSLFKLLVDFERAFPLEDILKDKTINSQTLLISALIHKNEEIINELLSILLNSCTISELVAYFNTKDLDLRTVGHYLFNAPDIIPEVSRFIDWLSKDDNGQTPLFAICRSYDTANYALMISTVLVEVKKWYIAQGSEFDYRDHIDNRGNSLLHILNSNVSECLETFKNVDINHVNEKGLTPLMVYVKYNRIHNVREILEIDEVDLDIVDNSYFSAVDQSKNPEISKLLELKSYHAANHPEQNGSFLHLVKIKYENSQWRLPILIHEHAASNPKILESNHNFQSLKRLVDIIQGQDILGFVPLGYVDSLFDISLNLGNVGNKLKFNRFISEFNVFLGALCLNYGLVDNAFIWKYIKNPTISTKTAIEGEDSGKQATEVNYQPEDINEIHIFLKYSLKELKHLKSNFNILHKIMNFHKIKTSELPEIHQLLTSLPTSLIPELSYLSQVLNASMSSCRSNSRSKLCTYILYLSLSADTIVAKVSNFISDRLFQWWRVYGELIELIKSHEKYQPYTQNHKHAVNESSFGDLTRALNLANGEGNSVRNRSRSGSGSGAGNSSSGAGSSFFSNFIESKRKSHLANLANLITGNFQKLSTLNIEIKRGREMLALEINNFFVFKSKFMRVFIREFVKIELNDSRKSLSVLKGALDDLRRLKEDGSSNVSKQRY